MITRTEIDFSTWQIKKAEVNLAYQIKLMKIVRLDTDPRSATVAKDLLNLIEDRLALLLDRHERLVASTDGAKDVNDRTEVASIIVGDAP